MSIELSSASTYDYLMALGSSLGERQAYLCAALRLLSDRIHQPPWKLSSLYQSQPLGEAAHQTFLNAALWVQNVEATPCQLLEILQEIEDQLGRRRNGRWQDRTIDLDIIAAYQNGRMILSRTAKLTIPHPEALHRDFVLAPCAEIAPHLTLDSSGRTLGELWMDFQRDLQGKQFIDRIIKKGDLWATLNNELVKNLVTEARS